MQSANLLGSVCLFMSIALGASAQVPFQVKDLNPGVGDGVDSFHLNGFGFGNNGRFYFAGTDGAGDEELWVSDGSQSGTTRIADLNPAASSSPARFSPLDATKILFRARHENDGVELWITDGTLGGTAYVKDLDPGYGGSFPTFGAAFGGEVFFRASDADGSELWKTDGTSGGTTKVEDIRPGPGSSLPTDFVVANGQVFFSASDGPGNQELWTCDGTTTTRISDLNPGSGNSEVSSLYVFDGWLYFLANDGTHGREIWRTNGTPGNATRLTDVSPGIADGVFPSQFCGVGGVLVFAGQDGVNGRELWATDGTSFLKLIFQATPGLPSSFSASVWRPFRLYSERIPRSTECRS